MFLKKILSLLIVVASLISCSNDKVAVANNIEVSIDSLKAVSGFDKREDVFEYKVDNNTFTNTNDICGIQKYNRFNDLNNAKEKAKKIFNKDVVVHFNPRNPKQSCLLQPMGIKYYFLFFVLFGLGIFLLML